jgi:hypothetical protein
VALAAIRRAARPRIKRVMAEKFMRAILQFLSPLVTRKPGRFPPGSAIVTDTAKRVRNIQAKLRGRGR